MERSETGWNAASNPPRWRSLLDRALLGRGEQEVDYAAAPVAEQRRPPAYSGRASARIEFQPVSPCSTPRLPADSGLPDSQGTVTGRPFCSVYSPTPSGPGAPAVRLL